MTLCDRVRKGKKLENWNISKSVEMAGVDIIIEEKKEDAVDRQKASANIK